MKHGTLVRKNGSTSNILRVHLETSAATTGAGLTGLTSASTGLVISTIADNEASATTYAVAGSNVETITTLGTFAAPTSGKCRFKEVDATNLPGVYEIQIADGRFAVSSAKTLTVLIHGATNLKPYCLQIDLAGYALTAAGLDAVVAESGINIRQAVALCLSKLCGKRSGMATSTNTYKGADNSTTRIVETTDSDGNCTASTLTPPS